MAVIMYVRLYCYRISHAVTARGCRFPPDHPSFSQGPVHGLSPDALHVYTKEFGDCSGRVSELNLCYRPSPTATSNETILTIFIISSDNVIIRTHNITVDPVADRSDGGRINCRPDDLTHPYCCVTHVLEPSEQFIVDSNFHYAMRTYMGVSSPEVHSSEQTPGYILSSAPAAVVGSSVAYSSPVSVQKPMFYFSLTQGTGTHTQQWSTNHACSDFCVIFSTPSMTYLKPFTTNVQATSITVPSVAISHSPPHTEDGGGGSGGASINSLFVGVGVAGALLLLITAPVIIITVLVCLRWRNNKLNTTARSMDSLYTNEVYNGSTSSNKVTNICTPTSINKAYLEVGSIPNTNQAYFEASSNGHTSNTDIPTYASPAYLEDGPVYEDADILTSINQAYLKNVPCQGGSGTLTYDYIDT